jgi:hypothetical protein
MGHACAGTGMHIATAAAAATRMYVQILEIPPLGGKNDYTAFPTIFFTAL